MGISMCDSQTLHRFAICWLGYTLLDMYFLALCHGKFSFWECGLSCSIHFDPLPLICDIFTYMYHHSSSIMTITPIIYIYTNIHYIIPYTEDTPPKTNGWNMRCSSPFQRNVIFQTSKCLGFQPLVFGDGKLWIFPQNRGFFASAFRPSPQGRVEEAKETLVTLRGDAYAETLIQEAIR